jgi:hypothetical protein
LPVNLPIQSANTSALVSSLGHHSREKPTERSHKSSVEVLSIQNYDRKSQTMSRVRSSIANSVKIRSRASSRSPNKSALSFKTKKSPSPGKKETRSEKKRNKVHKVFDRVLSLNALVFDARSKTKLDTMRLDYNNHKLAKAERNRIRV